MTETTNVATKNVKNKKKGNKKTIAAAVSVGALLALGGGTMATWVDDESAQAQITTGNMNMQISNDGQETWVDDDVVSIDIAGISDDVGGDTWRPGDTASAELDLRLDEASSVNAVVTAADVEEEITGVFADPTFSYTITSSEGDFVLSDEGNSGEFTLLGDGTPVTLDIEYSFEDTADVPQGADGSALTTFAAEAVAPGGEEVVD